ncbi:MAG: DUF4861 domain-containing protein [Bacteroidota bacterium]
MKRHILKTYFLLCFVAPFTIRCGSIKQVPGDTIRVSNSASIDLANKPVILKRTELIQLPGTGYYPVITNERKEIIPSQLDDLNGDNSWDELFFVADLPAKKQAIFFIQWTKTPPSYTKKTSVRFGVRRSLNATVQPAVSDTFYPNQLPGVMGYQRYQTDGPTWENDKVGFRQYLDGRNSIDVFGKKTPAITPENVGINNAGITEPNYSNMQDWGTDILHVGNSVGVGGAALLIGDSLLRLGITEQDRLNNVDSTIFNIVTEGPVRSMMQIDYRGWKPANRDYSVIQKTSIIPGTYSFRNEFEIDRLKGDEVLLAGLVNSRSEQQLSELVVNDKWVVLYTHDKQSVNKEWFLGMALVVPKENYLGYIKAPITGSVATSWLAKLKPEEKKPLAWYAVACWELSDPQFKELAFFKAYITELVKQLSAEVSIQVN